MSFFIFFFGLASAACLRVKVPLNCESDFSLSKTVTGLFTESKYGGIGVSQLGGVAIDWAKRVSDG